MAKPFVKWAGGKARLLPELLPRVPKKIGTYAEPFAGGAAVFFAVAGHVLAGARTMKRAVLTDQNAELVACYRAVRDDVDAVLRELRAYRYDRDLFYEVRARDTRGMPDAARAARVLFLNRTCFNGLWRENARGEFNVPFGRYENPRIVDEEGLRQASAALRLAVVELGDFEASTQGLGEGDFVYFDPPYVPLTRTASFTDYVAGGFGPSDQERLAREVWRLKGRGVKVMLSNADTPETRALYQGLALHVVAAKRAINSDATKRGATRELVVLSWGRPGVYGDEAVGAEAPREEARVRGVVAPARAARVARRG